MGNGHSGKMEERGTERLRVKDSVGVRLAPPDFKESFPA